MTTQDHDRREGELRFPVLYSSEEWRGNGTPVESIPWSAIAPHERQARKNHGRQSLQRLAQRGGLSVTEILAVMENRDWTGTSADIARGCDFIRSLNAKSDTRARPTQAAGGAALLIEAVAMYIDARQSDGSPENHLERFRLFEQMKDALKYARSQARRAEQPPGKGRVCKRCSGTRVVNERWQQGSQVFVRKGECPDCAENKDTDRHVEARTDTAKEPAVADGQLVERVARAIRRELRRRGYDYHMADTDEPSVADCDLARAAIGAAGK